MILSGPRGEAQADKPHVMAAVIGVRGGVGASTIATSLAWLFGEKAHRSTALLDLDVHFGTGALALDLEPGRGLTDAIENPSRIDGLFIERAMVRANERLSVLSAEAPIHQPLVTDGTAFFQLQEEMRNAFESTVLDLPRHMLIQYPHLVHDAHVAVVVAELTLAGDARHDPHPRLAEVERTADQGDRGRQRRPVGRRAGDQPQGFRAVDRTLGRHRLPVRRARSPPRRPSSASRWLKLRAASCPRRSTRSPSMVLSHASEEGSAAEASASSQCQVAGRQPEVDAREAEGQGRVGLKMCRRPPGAGREN